VNANNKLLANFAEKTLEDGTKPKMEIWVVNLGEAFNVRRRNFETSEHPPGPPRGLFFPKEHPLNPLL